MIGSPRGRVRSLTVAVAVALLAMACTSDPPADEAADVTSPGGLPTASTFVPTPTSEVPYVAPTSLRSLPVDGDFTNSSFHALSPTEVLVQDWNESTGPPDWHVVDVESGEVTPMAAPELGGQLPSYATFGFAMGDGIGYAVVSTCDDLDEVCGGPAIEIWSLESASRAWTLLGRFPPSELVPRAAGEDWMGVTDTRIERGRLHFTVTNDPTGDREVPLERSLVLDPSTGVIGEAPLTAPRARPDSCKLDSGAEVRAEPGGSWALQTRARGETDWTQHDDLAPAYEVTCRSDTVWTLAHDRWTHVDSTGDIIESAVVPGLYDPEVGERRLTVVEGESDRTALVVALGRDLKGDQFRDSSEVRFIVMPGGGSTALTLPWEPLPEHVGVGTTYGAVELPGGRVTVPVDIYWSRRWLVAE